MRRHDVKEFKKIESEGASIFARNIGTTAVRDVENILPEKERARVMNEILEWRLDHIIPDLMRREGIDM